MKHVGWMVYAGGQFMYWPVEDEVEARTYCEDGAEPVKLMAGETALAEHMEQQGD